MIYISGRITGNENWKEDFQKAEEYLESKGYDYSTFSKGYFNPLRMAEQINKIKRNATYADYMREDISKLVFCEEIYMLRGWWRSKGARLEHHIARVLGMKIIYQKRGDK